MCFVKGSDVEGERQVGKPVAKIQGLESIKSTGRDRGAVRVAVSAFFSGLQLADGRWAAPSGPGDNRRNPAKVTASTSTGFVQRASEPTVSCKASILQQLPNRALLSTSSISAPCDCIFRSASVSSNESQRSSLIQ